MCLYPHMAAHHCGETERREHVILLLIYPFRLAYKINQKTLSRARKGLRELQTIKGTDSQEEGCFRRGRADNSVTLDMLSHFFLTKMFFFHPLTDTFSHGPEKLAGSVASHVNTLCRRAAMDICQGQASGAFSNQ